MYSTNPFTGGRACNAMIIFNAPLGVKPVITPSRGSANHHFSGGYDCSICKTLHKIVFNNRCFVKALYFNSDICVQLLLKKKLFWIIIKTSAYCSIYKYV